NAGPWSNVRSWGEPDTPGAATAPRWETIHGKLKNDRGSNRPVPDRACGRIAHQSRFDVGAGRGAAQIEVCAHRVAQNGRSDVGLRDEGRLAAPLCRFADQRSALAIA